MIDVSLWDICFGGDGEGRNGREAEGRKGLRFEKAQRVK